MPETDVVPLVAWSLQQNDGALLLYEFDQSTGRLQLNGEVEYVDSRVANVLGVLLRHADSPVTSDDFLEAGMQTKGGGAVRKAMDTLQKSHIVGKHILQVGHNKHAVYSLLTNPTDTGTLVARMQDMHEMLYGGGETKEASRHKDAIKKLGAISAGLVGVATAYTVVRKIHKR